MTRGLTRSMSRRAARELGIQGNVAGLTCNVTGDGGMYKLVFTLNNVLIPVTDALAYASQKLFDFAEGKIRLLGGTASLAFGVTTARTTINDNAAMDWSLGSVAASSVTLATTMVDFIAKQDKTLDGVADAYTTAQAADFAAAATFDGTTTPVDLFLNVSFPTTTEIDADGTLKVFGKITLLVQTWGDT